jgi:hypothetical protein
VRLHGDDGAGFEVDDRLEDGTRRYQDIKG